MLAPDAIRLTPGKTWRGPKGQAYPVEWQLSAGDLNLTIRARQPNQAMTGKLLAVAQELVSSRERAGLGEPSDGGRAHNAPPEVVSHGVWEEPLGSLHRQPPSPSWPLRSSASPAPLNLLYMRLCMPACCRARWRMRWSSWSCTAGAGPAGAAATAGTAGSLAWACTTNSGHRRSAAPSQRIHLLPTRHPPVPPRSINRCAIPVLLQRDRQPCGRAL